MFALSVVKALFHSLTAAVLTLSELVVRSAAAPRATCVPTSVISPRTMNTMSRVLADWGRTSSQLAGGEAGWGAPYPYGAP